MRDIASTVHMSFGDIGNIIKSLDGESNDGDVDLSNKSKETQALWLFEQKKRPIDVAIELDMSYARVEELQQEYWALQQLYDLAFVYLEIKNDLPLFLQIFHAMKKNKLINQKDIQTVLRYSAFDIPFLENKIQKLTSNVIDMEWEKKRLVDEVVKLNSSLSQLEKLQKRLKMEIGLEKDIISNLNQQINQKSDELQEKITRNSA